MLSLLNRSKKLAILLALVSLLLAACAPQPAAKPAELPTLKIALLPVLDALPVYVAEKEGLFEQAGVKVEIIPVGSAPERDQLIAAGQADLMINEVVSTLFINKDGVKVQIVRFARAAASDSPIFRILASKKSGITGVDGLKGASIGVSDGTVIAYLTDRLLQAEGFKPEDNKTVSVPKISDRMALLMSGELQTATMPDPLATLAVQQGAAIALEDSTHPEYSHSTLTVRKEVLDQKTDAVRAFLAAWEKAVGLINGNPSAYATLLVEKKVVPDTLKDFKVPTFVTAGVPSEQQFNDAEAWAKEKGLLKVDVSYADCVNPGYLPAK